jgi:hypothetical protein
VIIFLFYTLAKHSSGRIIGTIISVLIFPSHPSVFEHN